MEHGGELHALPASRYPCPRTLSIAHEGRNAVRADIATKEGRLAVEAFFGRFMPHDLRGPPKVLAAQGDYRFTDSRSGFVSL